MCVRLCTCLYMYACIKVACCTWVPVSILSTLTTVYLGVVDQARQYLSAQVSPKSSIPFLRRFLNVYFEIISVLVCLIIILSRSFKIVCLLPLSLPVFSRLSWFDVIDFFFQISFFDQVFFSSFFRSILLLFFLFFFCQVSLLGFFCFRQR